MRLQFLGGAFGFLIAVLGPLAAIAAPVEYEVVAADKAVLLPQTTSWTGWAAAFATMQAWKSRSGRPDASEALKGIADGAYVTLFSEGKAMPIEMKQAFVKAMAAEVIAPKSLTIGGWEALLRDHGPLWLTVPDGSKTQPYFAFQSRIIKMISGDGTLTGTMFTVVDPREKTERRESVAAVLESLEAAARAQNGNAGEVRPQIIVYPRVVAK